ncbi:MAG: hypothetical protein ACRC6X_01410, partial [Culicoidibacterales bacterium]
LGAAMAGALGTLFDLFGNQLNKGLGVAWKKLAAGGADLNDILKGLKNTEGGNLLTPYQVKKIGENYSIKVDFEGAVNLVMNPGASVSKNIKKTSDSIGKNINLIIKKLIPSLEIRERIIDNLLKPIEDEIGDKNKEKLVS